jgi:hypothetical protein
MKKDVKPNANNFYKSASGTLSLYNKAHAWGADGDSSTATTDMPATTATTTTSAAPAASGCGCSKKKHGMVGCFAGGLLIGVLLTYIFTHKSGE